MKLDVRAFGLAMGILWGAGILFLDVAAMALPGRWGEAVIMILANVYVGYDTTIQGAVIGTAWAFADGLVGGAALAWLYNRLAR